MGSRAPFKGIMGSRIGFAGWYSGEERIIRYLCWHGLGRLGYRAPGLWAQGLRV